MFRFMIVVIAGVVCSFLRIYKGEKGGSYVAENILTYGGNDVGSEHRRFTDPPPPLRSQGIGRQTMNACPCQLISTYERAVAI